MGCCENSAQREIHGNTAFLKKEERFQIDNLTHHLNELEKEEQAKSTVSRGRKSERSKRKSIK